MLALLICNSSNIKRSIFSIKEFGYLLKWSIPCFHQEEVDDCNFKGKEDAIADVVFPLEGFEGDGVDVLVCWWCQWVLVGGMEGKRKRAGEGITY